MGQEGREIAFKTPVGGLAWTAMGERAKELGPYCGNFHNWMRKIKKAFDPNTASDPSGYTSAD